MITIYLLKQVDGYVTNSDRNSHLILVLIGIAHLETMLIMLNKEI
jgi:hypothetical protein